jgi:hypothetical protein
MVDISFCTEATRSDDATISQQPSPIGCGDNNNIAACSVDLPEELPWFYPLQKIFSFTSKVSGAILARTAIISKEHQ